MSSLFGMLGKLVQVSADNVKASVADHSGLASASVDCLQAGVGNLVGADVSYAKLSLGGHDGLLGLKISNIGVDAGADHQGHYNWHC